MGYKFIDEKKEHLHTLGGKPLIGTSTATKIISKPLTWWAAGMAMATLGWKNGKTTSKEDRLKHAEKFFEELKGLTLEEYVNRLDEGYAAHSKRLKETASDGVDLHAELEGYVKNCLLTNEGKIVMPDKSVSEQVGNFAGWAKDNVKRFIFSEAHCYSEKLWLGGISDCGAELKDGTKAIIDFKSSKEAYFDQFIQCALYDLQFSENGGFDKDGNRLFEPMQFGRYIIIPFGAKEFAPKERYDVAEFRKTAEATLTLYKHSLNYEK